ncbi:unnamed protein product [Cunninghamella echinulata]
MDLKSMLISEPTPTTSNINYNIPNKKPKPQIIQKNLKRKRGSLQGYLNTSLLYPTLSNTSSNVKNNAYQSPFHQNNNSLATSQKESLPPPTCPKLGPEVQQNPALWCPKLSLEIVNKD